MIKATNLVKYFDDFCALDHTSVNVPKGSIYGLVGPNGAGKSTLIRHITGVYRPAQGEILIDGEPIFENNNAKRKIAYIPDDIFYFFQASTLDMKKYYAGIYPDFDFDLFEKLGEFFPAIDVKRSIRKLSKGMQKQAAFWLALCCNPQLLILDEPVDGLDPVMRRQLWGLILNRVQDYKTTVFISSHNLRELEDVCEHVGIMHKGKIILEHSLSDMQTSITKIQIAFENSAPILPPEVEVLHTSSMGRVYTIIAKGDATQIRQELEKQNPLYIEFLPLTLEEIFIYELGGTDYAVKEIFI